MSESVVEEMRKASVAVSDATVLRNNEGSRESIANRLYYACYHAAKGVLYAEGHQPKTHAGVVAQFGEHIVKEGPASEADRRFLARSQTRREKADYEYEPLREDVDELFARTEEFVAKMEQLV
jgi:uncharacterized protein (UPF0332 family)